MPLRSVTSVALPEELTFTLLSLGAGQCAVVDSPSGRTLLIESEQGLGDTIQFSRFVPRMPGVAGVAGVPRPDDAAPRGRIIFRCDGPVLELMRTLPDRRIEVVRCDDAIPAHDVHFPLMSLPRALGVHAEWQFVTIVNL